jgi:hypothetical protein
MTEQLGRIERELGELRGTADGILREVTGLGRRLEEHVAEDRQMAERIGHIERAHARLVGAAGVLGALCGAVGSLATRWLHSALGGS